MFEIEIATFSKKLLCKAQTPFIRRLGSRRVHQKEKKKVGPVIQKNW
jgi:hypothetical protein